MTDYLINFENIPWEACAVGAEQKVFFKGDQQLRLLKFSDNFVEEDWCLKGHVGFVAAGEMEIDFNGEIKSFKKGDGLWIDGGEASKHKEIVGKGKQVELILFETV